MQFPFSSFHLLRDKFNFKALKHQLREYRIVWINLGILLTLAVAVLIGSFHHDNDRVINAENNQAQRTKIVMQQLNDINDEIHTLESSPQNGAALKDALNTITKNLSNVQQSLSGIKDDMDSQMSDLRKAIQSNGKQYLDAKALPFKVISIDVISERPYVSIDYDHLTTALPVGSALAGWQLVSADYQQSTAEFKNSKDQYVKVIIGG